MKRLGFENKIVDYLLSHYRILFFVVVTVISILARYYGYYFISGDMKIFLFPWFEEIGSNGGLNGLNVQVGDYNILYQTIIAIGTHVTDNPLLYYKGISIAGDYFLAITCAYTLTKVCNKSFVNDNTFYITYGCVIMLPIVVFNSSFWGQCDGIYTAFLIWTLYFLYSEKYRRAFIMYGVAFAFKLQSVFLLPLIIILYFSERKFSVLNFLFTIGTFWLTGLAGFLNGRNLTAPFEIYLFQSVEYKRLFINFESFWRIMATENQYSELVELAVLLTVVLMGFMLFVFISHKIVLSTYEEYLAGACMTVWTVLMFLPAMHERYSYLLDILLVMLVVLNIRYCAFAFFEIIVSMYTYGVYFFRIDGNQIFFSILEIVLWFAFVCVFFYKIVYAKKDNIKKENEIGNGKDNLPGNTML